jgi:hypothetical protein
LPNQSTMVIICGKFAILGQWIRIDRNLKSSLGIFLIDRNRTGLLVSQTGSSHPESLSISLLIL